MGFLFDKVKNLVGDIECTALALDQGISERICDRYTKAPAKNVYTESEESIPIQRYKSNEIAGIIAANGSGSIAKIIYDEAMKILPKYVTIGSANIISNTLATMVLSGKDVYGISIDDIIEYGDMPNIHIDIESIEAAGIEFANNIMFTKNDIISKIENGVRKCISSQVSTGVKPIIHEPVLVG